MEIINFEVFLITITILTLTPGLDTAVIIRNTSRSGTQYGLLTSFGICCGLFVHATFSAIGISAIIMQSAEWFTILKFVGAGYLVWLGIGSIRGVLQVRTSLSSEIKNPPNRTSWVALREGFLSNVLNPKTAVFYLAFLPQFIDPNSNAFAQSMIMASIHFAIAYFFGLQLYKVKISK